MRKIFITGAAREDGIGYQVVRQLTARGDFVIVGVRDVEAAKKVLAPLGDLVQVIELDVASENSLAGVRARIEQLSDTLDVVINNAGILLDGELDVTKSTRELFEKTFAINTIGPVRVVQELLPLLHKASAPRIINVSSGAGQLSDKELSAWAPAYSSSKAALNALTQQLAAALPKVAVNSVCPGWCPTHMGGGGAPRSAEEGADTIVWLATEAPQEISGQFLRDRKEIVW
jgi:NAD(P)-dependent dehydrogenase (short-subunit alcohol dehydrogenase family)